MQRSAVVSNGHFKFRLATLAAELDREGWLDRLITGGYPIGLARMASEAPGVRAIPAVQRLRARGEAGLATGRIAPQWLSEALIHGLRLAARSTGRNVNHWDHLAWRVYTATAGTDLRRSRAAIFHYRGGYGRGCIDIARAKGMCILGDSPLLFPGMIDEMVLNGGKLSSEENRLPAHPRFREMASDLARADCIVVNSHFSKETFLARGWAPGKVRVQYTGVDDRFLSAIRLRREPSATEPLRLVFAGELNHRKGAEFMIGALESLTDLSWRLEIIGDIDPHVVRRHATFLADPRVAISGNLPRVALADRFAQSDVLIFPSLAEGSARVVFEALACGCHVITTPNAGSIVGYGAEGDLIPPGDAGALASAVRSAVPRRARLSEVGRCNQRLIQNSYTQRHYVRGIIAIYEELLDGRKGMDQGERSAPPATEISD